MMSVSHAFAAVVAVNKVLHLFGLFRRSQKASARHSRQQSREFTFMTKRLACTAYEVIKPNFGISSCWFSGKLFL